MTQTQRNSASHMHSARALHAAAHSQLATALALNEQSLPYLRLLPLAERPRCAQHGPVQTAGRSAWIGALRSTWLGQSCRWRVGGVVNRRPRPRQQWRRRRRVGGGLGSGAGEHRAACERSCASPAPCKTADHLVAAAGPLLRASGFPPTCQPGRVCYTLIQPLQEQGMRSAACPSHQLLAAASPPGPC